MKDKQKIEAILNLLTNQNVGMLADDGQLVSDEEKFGALVFSSYTFNKAYKIARQ
jgi:hypothetical protein